MATAESHVKVKIGGDSSELEEEFRKSESDAEKFKSSVVGSMRRMASGVSSVVLAFDKVKSAMEKAMAPVVVIRGVIDAFNWLRNAIKGADEATRELGASALDVSNKIKATGLVVELYNAIKAAADGAQISADELSRKLKEFAEHKITFDELAQSVNFTGEGIQRLSARLEHMSVGRRWLAEHEQQLQASEEAANNEKQERRGLRGIVRDIIRVGGKDGNNAAASSLWDQIAIAARGNRERIADIYNEYKPWWFMRRADIYGYATGAMDAAAERYERQKREREMERQAQVAAHDARVLRERASAASSRIEKSSVAVNARTVRAKNEAAAEEARRAQEAADREAARRQKVIDSRDKRIADETVKLHTSINAITVAAPAAASGLGAQGGLVGIDMAQINRENMERERNRKIDDIVKNFDKLMRELDNQTKKLLGEM